MLANYHTHTPRCHHAYGSEREYIEKAISAGFKVLGFSDHVPQPYPKSFISPVRMEMDELAEYTETLVSLREEYKNQIKILIGYEVEYTEKYFDELLKEINKYPLDYIIQGQHFIPDEVTGFYVGNPTDDEEKLKQYVDLTIEGMKTGVFSYLAHPDVINFTGSDEIYKKHMVRIIEASLKLDIPLEVNILGYILKRNYPCDRFYSMASEMGAKYIIGCDAHRPEGMLQPEQIEGFPEFLKRNGIVNFVPDCYIGV